MGLFGGLGRLAFASMPIQRRLVGGQLAHIFPDRTIEWRRRLGRSVFSQLGRNIVDVVRLPRLTEAGLLDMVRLPSDLDGVLEPGRGAIVVGGHYGAWELLPSILAATGRRGAVLVSRLREERLDRLLAGLRSGFGVEIVTTDDPVSACVRVPREGRVLLVAADQARPGRRVAGSFLGRGSWLSAGPASLALAASVPLVPMGIRLEADGRHRVLAAPPITAPERLDREAAIESLTVRFTSVLERWILEDPSQWAWFHERWKRVPGEG